MNFTGNVDSHISQPSPQNQKAVEKPQSEQNNQVQIQQSTTGLEWAAQTAAGQQMVSQQVASDPNVSRSKIGTQAKSSSRNYELKGPNIEDIAMLSTSASIKDESVAAATQKGIFNFLRQGFNMAAMEEAYREFFKKSKSHNLLLERFMANVKFSVFKGLFSMLGVSAEEQEKIQREVREKALAEIDSRLKNEWAYSKAMLEIVG